MRIVTILEFPLSPVKMAIIKKTNSNKPGDSVGRGEAVSTDGGDVN